MAARDPLGTEDQAFHRLTARIKGLQARIETAERENRELDSHYLGQFRPALQAHAQAMMKLAMQLEETAARHRPGKAGHRPLKRVIPALLQEAFQLAEPTPEALILHDTYAPRSYRILQDEAETGEAVPAPLEPADAPAEPPAQAPPRPRRKSRKELDRELRERQRDRLKQRSLRDVYLALAKVLHPDAELDPGRKTEKEAFLKRVTSAYREGNLVELLHLEMACLEQGGFQNTTADKLALWIELLKDQARDLEAACSSAENAFREAYPSFQGSIGALRKVLAREQARAEIETVRLGRLTARLEADPGFLEDCLAVLREDFN